ncbi:MAG: hypothetical protein RAK25_00940 [TACK group archaeon]|nr:hypothetical protein [TACK group archaeon]
MCDTLVSLANNNAEKGVTYFAKNSDREPDEPQLVEYYSSAPREGKIRVTRVEVEAKGRVEASRIVISRPTWMWGLRWASTSTASRWETRRSSPEGAFPSRECWEWTCSA